MRQLNTDRTMLERPASLEALGLRRVLMTVDTVGGVWTHGLDLAEQLARRGVAVTLASLGPLPSPAQREAVERLGGVGLEAGDFRLEWMDDPWLDVNAAGEWLLELEARLHPDVVHLNGYTHGALPWRAPVLVGAHSCVSSWFRAVRGEALPPRWDAYRRKVAQGLRGAGCVAAPSGFMLRELRRHYGFSGRGVVIYNGRAPGAGAPREKEPFIFTAGRLWDEAKNAATLDATAREIPWPVIAAGETRAPGGSEASLDHLVILGRLEAGEVADWMARASVFALPALYEPFGLTPLEAALAGCALVLGDILSLREIWGEAAFFVPPRDTRALARALDLLMSDRELRADYAGRARARAAELTPERMASQYIARYLELVSALRAAR